jgi:hypothetical protein
LGVLLALLEPLEDLSVLLVAPLLVEPVDADESPFIMASNSARLSCPSLFLSALVKSSRSAPPLDLLAPAEELPLALLASAEELPPAEALPPAAVLPEALLLLCDVEGFACASLFFAASLAYADALAKANRDMLSSIVLNFK